VVALIAEEMEAQEKRSILLVVMSLTQAVVVVHPGEIQVTLVLEDLVAVETLQKDGTMEATLLDTDLVVEAVDKIVELMEAVLDQMASLFSVEKLLSTQLPITI
jgi:soluble P-type ATPase